jgi:hypothetical protein
VAALDVDGDAGAWPGSPPPAPRPSRRGSRRGSPAAGATRAADALRGDDVRRAVALSAGPRQGDVAGVQRQRGRHVTTARALDGEAHRRRDLVRSAVCTFLDCRHETVTVLRRSGPPHRPSETNPSRRCRGRAAACPRAARRMASSPIAAPYRRARQPPGSPFRPGALRFVAALPKTRSAKVMCRAVQAVASGADPEEPSKLGGSGTPAEPPAVHTADVHDQRLVAIRGPRRGRGRARRPGPWPRPSSWPGPASCCPGRSPS